jgi:peptidylprolyl isomerase
VTTSSGTRSRALPIVALAVVLGVTGCSGAASSSSAVAASASATAFHGVLVTGAMGSEPSFTMGDVTQGTSSLQIQDIVVGTGPAATATDKVTVQYLARSAKTKKPFDSSWARGKPFSYDPAKVGFKAFTEGVPGMKVGGRRLVIVPGPLAYGPTPPPSLHLGANETLVFVIDLVSIDK